MAAAGLYMGRHDSAPPNGLTGQMLFSLPHANPMEQSPNQLPQKLPILKYTRHREIEILSGVIYLCCQLNVIVLLSLKQTQR